MPLRTERARFRDKNRHSPKGLPFVQEAQMKQCTKCKEWKDKSEFRKNNGKKDGLHTCCKTCHSKASKAYYESHKEKAAIQRKAHHEANREKHLAQMKVYNDSHKEEKVAYQKSWYAANREEQLKQRKVYQAEHRDETNVRARKRYEKFPEKSRAYYYNRRFRIKGNGGKLTDEDIRLQYKSQKGKCWWCGKPFVKGDTRLCQSVDHIIPLKRGGTNNPSNIVLAHRSCNSSKKDKMPWEWIGRLL